MNNRGKELYERALHTELVFGNRANPNAIILQNVAISKRNFEGRTETGKKKDGRPFTKEGRRFTINLTEDLFNAICTEKGTCNYSIWAFGGDEQPDLKLYTIEVHVNMASQYPPHARLYTMGKDNTASIRDLNDTSIAVLDSVREEDIERVDVVLNPYDKDKIGIFTLYLNDIKMCQRYVEDTDNYWSHIVQDEEESQPNGEDPNIN